MGVPSRSWRATLGILFVAALALRLSYLDRLARSPFWGSLDADARLYWDWATSLLEHDFKGSTPFFLGPLYPYLLAVTRGVVGNSVGTVLVVQAFLGAASTVLIADASRRLTTPTCGALVGALIAGYQMAVFFDGLILMESLLFALNALLLWLAVRAPWNPPSFRFMAVLGILIGVLAQGRATAVLLLVPVALLTGTTLMWTRAAATRVGLLVGGCLVMAVPSTVHNWIVAHEWIPYTYSLGYNLCAGNGPEATGSFVNPTAMMPLQPGIERPAEGGVAGDGRVYLRMIEGRELSPSESSRYWAGRALTYVAEHPARALKGAGEKVLMFWNRQEYSQVESVDVFRAVLGPIGLPVIGSFAFLAILSFGGWRPMWGRGPPGRVVIGYVLAVTVGIIPFFVTDRYRLHLVPGVALLAAAGIEQVLGRRRWRDLLQLAPALLLGATVVALPVRGYDKDRLAWETASTLGERWLARGRPDVALEELSKAVRIDEAGRLRGAQTAQARVLRADVYGNHATALMQLGRPKDAVVSCERAYALVPGMREASALAVAYAVTGSIERSRVLFAQIGMPARSAVDVLLREVALADKAGRKSQVEGILRAAIALDSTQTVPWVALIRLQVQLGRFDDAGNTLLRAKAAGLGDAAFFAHQALVAATRGDLLQASRALGRVSPAAGDSDRSLRPVLDFVRGRLRQAGRSPG